MNIEELKDFINRHRHHEQWQDTIHREIASQPPEVASELILSAIWHPDGASATTGYRPSAYEHLLHRDLLLAARCLSACEVLNASLTHAIVDGIIELYVVNHQSVINPPLRATLSSIVDGFASGGTARVAANALVARLTYEKNSVVLLAAQALGQVGLEKDRAAHALVQKLTQDDDVATVCHAAEALAELKVSTDNVTDALIAVLSHRDEICVHSAIGALRQLCVTTDQVKDALVDLLTHHDAGVVRHAGEVLVQLGMEKDRAANALFEQLTQKLPSVPQLAALSLAELGMISTRVLDELAIVVADEDQQSLIDEFWPALLSAVQQAEETGIALPANAYDE